MDSLFFYRGIRSLACVAFVAVSLGAVSVAHAQLPTGNLLTNPGAETGDLSNWTSGGDSAPNVDDGTFDSGISPHSGGFDFYGGSGLLGTLTQSVSLTGAGITPTLIDAGNLQANVSFWEQGLNQSDPSDNAHVILQYLDINQALLGTSTTDIIDSHDGTWKQYTGSFTIPVNTRNITYTMQFDRNVGSDNDAFVDDNLLSVSNASTTVSEAATLPLALLGSTGIALYPIFRAIKQRRQAK